MEEFSPVQTYSEAHVPQRMSELIPLVEAIIFAAPEPVRLAQIVEILGGQANEQDVEISLDLIAEFYAKRRGGFRLENLGKTGYQFRTTDEVSSLMERQFAAHARPLSRSALETLAIVAYRQPCTRADIEYIRGVDAGSIITGLLQKGLIACVGRKEDIGRPMLFGTTDEFLKVFRMGSIKELPSLQSFQPPPEVLAGAMRDTEETVQVDLEGLVANGEVDLIVEKGDTAASLMSSDDEALVDAAQFDNETSEKLPSGREASPYGASANINDGESPSTSEVDLTTGTGVPPRSGEVDPGETDPS